MKQKNVRENKLIFYNLHLKKVKKTYMFCATFNLHYWKILSIRNFGFLNK